MTTVDKGYAWLVLIACFIMRVLTEGFWSSMGILLVEWQTYFEASAGEVAIIGSMTLMVILMTAPFSAALSNRLTFRKVGVAGAVMMSVFLLATSLAARLWHIYVTVALAGIGLGLCLQISCVFCVFYFDKRLGFANGVCSSGASIGTLCLSPLFRLLIDSYGWRGATVIISAIMANAIVCAILLKSSSVVKLDKKGEEKRSSVEQRCSIIREITADFDLTLWRCENGRFLLFALNGFWLGIGYNTAVIYTVPYAIDVGITKTNASYLLSIFGISSFVGRLCHGWLIDNHMILPSKLGALCWLLSGLAICFVPVSNIYPVLATLLAVFGLCSGTGFSLSFIIIQNAVGTQKTSSGFAWMLLLNGIGALSGILLSGYMYDVTTTYIPSFLMSGMALVCASIFTYCDYYLERRHIKRNRRISIQPEQLVEEKM